MIVCGFSPPSDHEPNVIDVPPSVCGSAAKSAWPDLRGTLCVNGAVCVVPLTEIVAPGGDDCSVIATRFGVIVTAVDAWSPPLSVAVSVITKYVKSPWSATRTSRRLPGRREVVVVWQTVNVSSLQ